MGFNPVEIITKPVQQISQKTGLPAPPLPPIDPIDALTDPLGAGQDVIDIFRDPLSSLQGFPGIDGSESDADGGQLEVARRQGLVDQEQAAKSKKTKALLVKQQEDISRQSTIKTGSQGLASNDSASIATRTLLG